jgi:hypothetical protein
MNISVDHSETRNTHHTVIDRDVQNKNPPTIIPCLGSKVMQKRANQTSTIMLRAVLAESKMKAVGDNV